MDIAEYKNIYENEGRHFFYTSTHFLVTELVKRYSKGTALRILDAGCGTGGLMVKLAKYGSVTGVDANAEAIKFARKRKLEVTKASIEKLPFGDNTFDLVTSIDVIYHRQVSDDVRALKEFRRVLKGGGVLILRVPANKFLFSAHDRLVHTARRYTKAELTEKISKAGLTIKMISFAHAPIFLVSLLKVLMEKITRKQDNSAVGSVNPGVNWFLTSLLKFEAKIISRGVTMPFGQGLVAVATK